MVLVASLPFDFLRLLQLLLHMPEPYETLLIHQHGVGKLVAVVVRQSLHPQVRPGVVLPRPPSGPATRGVGTVPRTPIEVRSFELVPGPLILMLSIRIIYWFAVDISFGVVPEHIVLVIVIVILDVVFRLAIVLSSVVTLPSRRSLVSH